MTTKNNTVSSSAFAVCSSSALIITLVVAVLMIPAKTEAIPVFARKYDMSCVACHSAFPKLNAFGEQFAADNYRLPNWKNKTIDTGDDMLALPDTVPFAIRTQGFIQQREAEAVDVITGARESADTDIQSPYLIKLLSSAPLSEHISYYFYAILAEKGENGSVIVEDAWFSHDNIFDSGIGLLFGQFQVSDLMFPREVRLTFQDYMAYRMAGLTYERGAIFDYTTGSVDFALGLVNGNGITNSTTINSPGYRRPDHLFDNDSDKAVFGRVGFSAGPVNLGLFGYSGEQANTTTGGTASGGRTTDKIVYGIDLSGNLNEKTHWFVQLLDNSWDEFINAGQDYSWYGGFLGVDYIHSDRWAYSLLYNFANANDFDNSDTVYEGIDINSVTLAASYYFMRNVKAVFEVNLDMLDTQAQTGTYYTGHLTGENYALVGFDAAF